MVNIKTTVNSALDAWHPRHQRLKGFLLAADYEFSPGPYGWQAISYHEEGEDLKARLRQHGFADSEFQIRVEYQRCWGFM